MSLAEHEGTKCGKCQKTFFGRVDKCTQCNGPTEQTKWYSRFCIERAAFIATLVLIAAVVTPFVTEDPSAYLIVPLMTGFLVFSMYFTANYFMGIGGFTQRFSQDSVPPRAHLAFS